MQNPLFETLAEKEIFFTLKRKALDASSRYTDEERKQLKIMEKAVRNELNSAKLVVDQLLAQVTKPNIDPMDIGRQMKDQQKLIEELRSQLRQLTKEKNLAWAQFKYNGDWIKLL